MRRLPGRDGDTKGDGLSVATKLHDWGPGKRETATGEEYLIHQCRSCRLQKLTRSNGSKVKPSVIYILADGTQQTDEGGEPACPRIPPLLAGMRGLKVEMTAGSNVPFTIEGVPPLSTERDANRSEACSLVRSGRLLEAQELLSSLFIFETSDVVLRIRARLRDRVRELGGEVEPEA